MTYPALALAHSPWPLAQARNNQSAPLHQEQPLGKQTKYTSEQPNTHSGQTRTFIIKLSNGLSQFSVDFNVSLWTTARGNLSPRPKANTHKYGSPLVAPPPYWGFQIMAIFFRRFGGQGWEERVQGPWTASHLPRKIRCICCASRSHILAIS